MNFRPTIYLICILFIICLITGCKSVVTVNSDLKPNQVDTVRLDKYKSVQLRESKYQDSTLALGVAISGGGSRAQYYSLGVFIGLEEIKPKKLNAAAPYRSFLTDVDYFSTVSGGSLGAGYYLSINKNFLLKQPQAERPFYKFWLKTSYGSNLAGRVNYNATPFQLFSLEEYETNSMPSFPGKVDGQLLLATGSIKKKGGKIVSGIPVMQMSDFFIDDRNKSDTVKLPMLVTNGTVFNNAERIPFMPHILNDLMIVKSNMPDETWHPDNTIRTRFIKKSGLFNKGKVVEDEIRILDAYGMPMKYAIAASNAFPGIVPNVKFQVLEKRDNVDKARIENNSVEQKTITKKLKQLDEEPLKMKTVRIVDGGVVDNLGFNTLLELLKEEHKVPVFRRQALIIDCSGVGREDLYSPYNIGLGGVVTKSLYYTLSSKYAVFSEDIKAKKEYLRIDRAGHLKIGITDLRDTVQYLLKTEDSLRNGLPISQIITDRASLDSAYKYLNILRVYGAGRECKKRERNARWDFFFTRFDTLMRRHLKKNEIGLESFPTGSPKDQVCYLDLIKTKSFENFNAADLLLLYELASLVETNIKIRSCRERSILVLAGRYTVYLKNNLIRQLYACELAQDAQLRNKK